MISFEGYRRQLPQVCDKGIRNFQWITEFQLFQISLHLPYENLRNKKGLPFEPTGEELEFHPEHKDLKRSDPQYNGDNAQNIDSEQRNIIQINHETDTIEDADLIDDTEENDNEDVEDEDDNVEEEEENADEEETALMEEVVKSDENTNYNINNANKYNLTRHIENNINNYNNSNSKISHNNINNNNNKVLLTPQDRYIPNLPKVIISASASVSASSASVSVKKLNLSVGNVLATNSNHPKTPPTSYDDYKEDDVLLDPFFIDVPKIQQIGSQSGNSNINAGGTFKTNGGRVQNIRNLINLRNNYEQIR